MADFTKLTENLQKKGYCVHEFATREEAAGYMDAQIDGRTVGIGGSTTVAEMKLYEKLTSHNTVYWHDRKPENLTVAETRKLACRSEVYISSVNGISENGEIVNIDNTGNRVSAISFGPDKVWLVIGENKLAPDFEAALYRARNVAAPKNAQRLHRKTPCAEKGDHCYDCSSPERICRNLSVLWTRPAGVQIEIVLIHEALGY